MVKVMNTTLKELEATYTGIFSVKDDTPKGRKEKSFYDLKVGDKVLIDNHFVEIVEDEVQEEKKNYDELVKNAIELVDNNLVELVEELNSWNGFADGFRLYYMEYELDELHHGMKLSEFLEEITSDFDIRDTYWYYSIYGLESTSMTKYDFYNMNTDLEEVYDNILSNYSHLDIRWIDEELDEILEEILNYN